MPLRRVRLYARPDCPLCDAARGGLEGLRASGLFFEIYVADMAPDDELHARFLERIPVVELDGEIVSELFLDADRLRARLDTLSR